MLNMWKIYKLMMKKILIAILFMLVIPSSSHFFIHAANENVTINIALYKCDVTTNPYTMFCFKYAWHENGKWYVFNITEIGKEEVMKALNNKNFDVFIVGASAKSYLIDSFNEKWRHAIKKFVSNGGGYIGICGGANLASMGYMQPKSPFQRYINKGVLGIANVYINDDFDGEWQYLLKVNYENYSGQIGVKTKIVGGDIFNGYDKKFLNISYAGGPSFYLNNNAKPLLIYDEEPMYTKPIHYWIPSPNGWRIWKNVTTDIKEQAAAIETSYGKGKIFLFGPHPEEYFMENGSIIEYFGKSAWGRWKYVYSYVGGQWMQLSQNWWILRRTAAMASVDVMPPLSRLAAVISHPDEMKKGVYINNRAIDVAILNKIAEIIGRDIIIGNFTTVVYTVDGAKAEFYIDGKLSNTTTEIKEFSVANFKYKAFTWKLHCSNGFHTLKVIVYDKDGNYAWDERRLLFIA